MINELTEVHACVYSGKFFWILFNFNFALTLGNVTYYHKKRQYEKKKKFKWHMRPKLQGDLA